MYTVYNKEEFLKLAKLSLEAYTQEQPNHSAGIDILRWAKVGILKIDEDKIKNNR